MAGWDESMLQLEIKENLVVEKKKLRKDGINKTKEEFDGGMKHIYVNRDKRDTGSTSRRGRHGNSYIESTER